MAGKVIMTPKSNSFQFDDRAIQLDQPVKIGRAHKEDKGQSDNAFFDCKVLSRVHAILSYRDGKFFIQDKGSSNGSFINNIRLSKSGEESKVTELYTGDVLRFGSDVIDKAKSVTQKAIVSRIQLLYPNGTEVTRRPPDSKLFRPVDNDVTNVREVNSDSTREKLLEEKLQKVRGMILNHTGSSQSDLIRAFESLRQEMLSLGSSSEKYDESSEVNRLQVEKRELGVRLSEIEKKLENREEFCVSVQQKLDEDNIEIAKLRQLIDRQNEDLSSLENELSLAQREAEALQGDTENTLKQFYEEQIYNLKQNLEDKTIQMNKDSEQKLRELEESFFDERTSLRKQVQEVTSNEINLLERIKTLESEKEYARAEVDRIVQKDGENFDYRQELEFKVENLSSELRRTMEQLEEASNNVVVERSQEDIDTIQTQDSKLKQLREEISYIKKELIDARSRKAAAEDDLNTVKGTLETLNNTINTLTSEGEDLKASLAETQEKYQEKSSECNHLNELLAVIESQPGQDEKMKVQIADLKSELAIAQDEVKTRANEILQLKDNVREEKEIIQQKEIEISRLNGQVQFIEEEKDIIKSRSGDVDALEGEINSLKSKLNLVIDELEVTREDNSTLSSELEKLQVLYGELKKMRGMGEEIELLQQTQREVAFVREREETALLKLENANKEAARLDNERMRLMREIAAIKSGRADQVSETEKPIQNLTEEVKEASTNQSNEVGKKILYFQVGSLQIYELLMGLLFLSVIVSWNSLLD